LTKKTKHYIVRDVLTGSGVWLNGRKI